MSWQEMQSAPHDGTTIIVRYPLQGNVKRIASYNTRHKFWESNGEPFWPVQQHCQWAAIPPDVATPSPANGAVGEMPELPEPLEIDWPTLNSNALGCGVEDRGLHDRYECAEYGWQDGVDMAASCVPDAIYDADQMQAYARAAVLAEREQIAQMVDSKHESISDRGIIGKDYSDCGHNVITNIAALIRART